MKIKAIEFETAHQAMSHAAAEGGTAILINGKRMVVSEDTAGRLEEAKVEFAYLCDHGGRIVTIPVND